ncbi:ribosome quality control complex subunit NEMF [Nematostella vectensis]|uniref:ribosome quality control complex subunit NEMF n=1 Tax=Nematostella vectensis TaxID=45351 RepID=UPI0020776905|nr:ribosome quality control complex subunit NEMF [Nematostella vectensis]
MKGRFTTIDLCASITELKERLLGMRVVNVYDIDNKTYLIKLQRPEGKAMLLIESGNRMHTTEFEWPKSNFPSGFAIKLRKHLKQRRLVAVTQLGVDRIVDLQFGSNEAAYHLIIEFYDRGNIVLTDHEYLILNLLRRRSEKVNELKNAQENANETSETPEPKTEKGKGKGDKGQANEDVKFSVGQIYPIALAKQREPLMTPDRLKEIIAGCKPGEPLKKALNPHLIYGHVLLEHCFIESGLPPGLAVGKDLDIDRDLPRIMDALLKADKYLDDVMTKPCKGYIIQKREKKPSVDLSGVGSDELLTYQEFYPFLMTQYKDHPYLEFPSFDKTVDDFFSSIGSQKLDVKALNQEKSALKKLENVKKDHEKRIQQLQSAQEADVRKAQLIEINLDLVDRAILVVNSAIANQIDWSEILNLVKEAQIQGDPVASAIRELKLQTNHITMLLSDPFDDSDDSDDEDDNEDDNHLNKRKKKKKGPKGVRVDIDLSLSAYANARSHYERKKHSAKKEQKTIDHSEQALKSAQRKAKQTLKEVATTTSINKARKTYWFEKFLWFISSENYVVIGGRDQQQNELVVKRHLQPGDVYVHADLHGASSVIVKNKPEGLPIPPKTLLEAGTMAVCNSAAWDSKIVTSAWWVYHNQVSKTAPTGEYLTTGSFMIRGKKNFLPPCHLIMGFSFLFRVDDSCVEKHRDERRVRGMEDTESMADSTADTEVDDDLALADDGSDVEDGTSDVSSSKDDVTDAVNEVNGGVVEDDAGSLFPDTSIDLKVVSGKVELQRRMRRSSHTDNDDSKIFLGGDHVVDLRENKEKAEQLAKQRKAKQKRSEKDEGEMLKNRDADKRETRKDHGSDQGKKGNLQTSQQQQQQQQQQIKKGKKAKLKKMKEKYADQDEEERRLRMEILASAGPAKESKADKRKAKKVNKGAIQGKAKQTFKQQHVAPLPWEQATASEEAPPQLDKENEPSNNNTGRVTNSEPIRTIGETTNGKEAGNAADVIDGAGAPPEGLEQEEPGPLRTAQSREAWTRDCGRPEERANDQPDQKDGSSAVPRQKDKVLDDEEDDDEDGEENRDSKENISLLDALTGIPVADDMLLFAIPVCAPYTAVQNYKYKVKLTPGSTKKGKAAMSALNMFIQSKETSPREKDLLKSVKDVELSRYIPGKVKVSAPNLQKIKRK